MRSTTQLNSVAIKLCTVAMLMAGTAMPALAQTGDAAQTPDPAMTEDTANPGTVVASGETGDDIVVTGYRASLESQANSKRNSIGFTDSIFAEDIGKFPDTNIAESLNRIPGVTISREISGEGLNVAIRGLGTNFTRVLLNGAPVAIASSGRTDSQNTNREVDLDLLPTELFTQLTVSKSPTAAQVEGGAAGTVNLRSARPFDNPGFHVSYGAQAVKNSNADDFGYRGYALASATFGDFGILFGAAGVRNRVETRGYETIGYTNANLSATQRTTGTLNGTGGGNYVIPGTVPANAGNGLTTGDVINEAYILAHNPGATIEQIDNGLIPRLGRPSLEYGTRDRYNFIASAEWRPSDALHFYVDGMYGHKSNSLDRIDLNWVGRNGSLIPLNLTFDKTDCADGCTVTGGTFANAQLFLEYRPYDETTEFYGVNPGLDFEVNDWIKGDIQANYTHSDFRRVSPTVLVITPASSGVTVDYTNTGGIPQITSNIDLNDPSQFGWPGGRVNVQAEERFTETKGVRGSLTFGDDHFNARVGGSYDDTRRRITPIDNSGPYQNAVCGNNPSVNLPSPNTSTTPCTGLDQPGSATPAGFPTYPGYGTGYSSGFPPLTYGGSLIPQSELQNYLIPGPAGFITVDFDKFAAASNYDSFLNSAPEAGSSNTGASGGYVREKVTGTFVELNGDFDVGDNRLRLNGGVRYVRTDQTIGALTSVANPLNNTVAGVCPLPDKSLDGACYPNIIGFTTTNTLYSNFLPSASAAFEIGQHAVARASVSRTLTRPNPSSLLPGLNFSTPSADVGTLGNDALDPFISDNIDLGFEYYTGGEGLISVAAFRKSITGFTVNGTTTVPFSALAAYGLAFENLTPTQQAAINARGGPDAATVVLQQQVNSDGKLKVNGLEFQLVQPLDFLTKYVGLTGFGFQGNLTIIDQKGEGSGAPAIALGVAPTTYVLTGYYENHGLSARFAYTYNEGSQASGSNQNGIPNAAIFGESYDQLDFSGSVDLAEIFSMPALPSLTLDVTNITKSRQRSYFQFENAPFTDYQAGRTIMFGLRGRF